MSAAVVITILIAVAIAIILVIGVYCVRLIDAANEVDWGARWINRIDGIIRLFCRRFHRLSTIHLHIPHKGGAILVANHSSGLDSLLLIAASKRRLRFLIAREEYERFGFRTILRTAGCIPVDRETKPERAYREALRALNAGDVVAVFPHGGIRWPVDTNTKLKAGAVQLAQRTGTLLYPVYIEGVRGKGKNIGSFFSRSDAVTIHEYEPMDCTDVEQQQCLFRLAHLLNK